MTKLTYKCGKCNWEKTIPVEWGDLRPRHCGNKACLTSFNKNPEALNVIVPKKEEPVVIKKEEKQTNWKRNNERRDQKQPATDSDRD